jgi:hypothetical protein
MRLQIQVRLIAIFASPCRRASVHREEGIPTFEILICPCFDFQTNSTQIIRQNTGMVKSDKDIAIRGSGHAQSPMIQNLPAIALLTRKSTLQFESDESAYFNTACCWQYLSYGWLRLGGLGIGRLSNWPMRFSQYLRKNK